MLKKFNLCVAAFLAFSFLGTTNITSSAELASASRPLKCVYFIPADQEPCPDRAERLFRVMSYVQEFYRSEMERNGFGSTSFSLEEEAPGKLKLYEVRAPEKQEVYGRDSFWQVRSIIAKELEKQGIDVNQEVLVIFQRGLRWEDGKATEVSSFVGAGSPFYGAATCYDDPMLDPDNLSSKEPGGYYHRPCSVGEFNSHYIGGVAHELGHALTLPHDCETSSERREFGSALMGGGNHTMGREKRGEGKGAFLTYSEALRLSVVPAINGLEPKRRAVDVRLEDLKATRVSKNAVKFSGKIQTSVPVKGLIFYNDPDARASDYDAINNVVVPASDGSFELEFPEISPEPSELRVAAVREIDTIQLFKASYNPNGAPDEFAPVERYFRLRDVANLASKGDAEALNRLANNEFANDKVLKPLCLQLVANLTSPKQIVKPENVPNDVKSFSLSAAEFDEQRVGWSRLTRDIFFDGSILELDDVASADGLCAHAPSLLRVKLGRAWKTFKSGYGLQARGNGSVVFVVKGDGKELFRSELIKDHRLREVELDVSDVDSLELIVENGGNGNTSDHSIWIAPVLTR